MGTDSKIPDSADIPEPRLDDRVRHTETRQLGRVVGASTAKLKVCWDDDPDHRYWVDPAKLTVVTDAPPAARSVYVIEQRTNLAAGGHAFQLLPAGFAYPTVVNAQAAVEHMAGAMRWNDRLEGRQPGDRLPLYRIVEVPLDQPRGGVR